MTELAAYRDDGPLVRALAKAIGRPLPLDGPLAWLVPPLVHLVEYGLVIALTAVSDRDALPACFAFLGAVAFHHYETVYRLRHRHVPPPSWLQAAGGGWEGRVLFVCVLALVGALRLGLIVAAAVLALVYVIESARSWLRFEAAGPDVGDEGEDGVEDLE